MSTPKSNFINLILALGSVTLLSAFSLGYVYEWTLEPIANAQKVKQLRAINEVVNFDNDPLAEAFFVSDGKRIEEHPNALVFYPAKVKGKLESYAIKTYSNQGYSGKITVMVGLDLDGKIRGLQVLSHRETPGLGSKITSMDFLGQFIDQYPDQFDLKVTKDDGQVDGISGATISSRAVGEAVQKAYDNLQKLKSNE